MSSALAASIRPTSSLGWQHEREAVVNRRTWIAASLGVAACVSLLTAGSAAAAPNGISGAPALVEVSSGGFSPSPVQIYYRDASSQADSGTITWDFFNAASSPMTVTDQSGLGLYDTGPRHSPYKFTHVFTMAGIFPYSSTTTGTKSGVWVHMVRTPGSAPLGSSFTVRWASGRRTNCVFDVEIKHQGSPHWTYLRIGTTSLSTAFTPHKTGWNAIRSRVRNTVTHKASYFSPAVLIHVT